MAANSGLERSCGLPKIYSLSPLPEGAIEHRIHYVEIQIELAIQLLIETDVDNAIG